MPYLTQEDSAKFIEDCSKLLNNKGLLYVSFVEGDPKDSGFISNNTRDRVFFNYYDLEGLKKLFLAHQLENITVQHVEFPRTADTCETHTILLGQKK